MYQRLLIISSSRLSPPSAACRTAASTLHRPNRLAAQPQHELHHVADDHVGKQEEHRGQRHHDEHHGRRDPDLFPGRPRDLRCLLTHLFDEVKRVLHHGIFTISPRSSRAACACGSPPLSSTCWLIFGQLRRRLLGCLLAWSLAWVVFPSFASLRVWLALNVLPRCACCPNVRVAPMCVLRQFASIGLPQSVSCPPGTRALSTLLACSL